MTTEAMNAPKASGADAWREFERFGQLLQKAQFRFARMMADNPHSYTLRKTWRADDDWVSAVTFLRAHGYKSVWKKSRYIQIDVNEHFYWTMGFPINHRDGAPCTILINRKRIERSAPYDVVAWAYDELFRTEEAQQEQQAIVRLIDGLGLGPISALSVLDVGCGTGMLLRHASPRRYIGIDPSAGMLTELRHRHPHAATVQTPLALFSPAAGADRYDLVLSLFGVGSYLSNAELGRIPHLLRPGGLAVTMFYAPGFTAEQYRSKKAAQIERRAWQPASMPGTIVPSARDNFVTVISVKE